MTEKQDIENKIMWLFIGGIIGYLMVGYVGLVGMLLIFYIIRWRLIKMTENLKLLKNTKNY